MKVLLINGSPNPEGCTYTALREVGGAIEAAGLETEIFQLGAAPVYGCTGCERCVELKKCVFDGDIANALADKMAEADGIVIGSPVYYSSANGALCAVLDRVFYSSARRLKRKPGAAIVNCRRGGASSAFDRLNKYFTISQMPVVSSQYWNAVHGFTPEDVLRDLEGLQIMRTLGANMAWLIKAIAAAPPPPRGEKRIMTSFSDGK